MRTSKDVDRFSHALEAFWFLRFQVAFAEVACVEFHYSNSY